LLIDAGCVTGIIPSPTSIIPINWETNKKAKILRTLFCSVVSEDSCDIDILNSVEDSILRLMASRYYKTNFCSWVLSNVQNRF